jgi:hypothetical protein
MNSKHGDTTYFIKIYNATADSQMFKFKAKYPIPIITTSSVNQFIIMITIIMIHHEFRTGWPDSLSSFTSSSSLFSGRPSRRLPFG